MFPAHHRLCLWLPILLCVLLLSVVSSAAGLPITDMNWGHVGLGMTPSYFLQADCGGDACGSIGGFGSSGVSNEFYAFDGHSFLIFNVENPPARGGGALVVLGSDKFNGTVLFGGTLEDGSPTFDAYLFNGMSLEWKLLAVPNMTNKISGFGTSIVDRELGVFYTFFGFSDAGLISTISRADVDPDALTITWSAVVVTSSVVPSPRFGATCQYSPPTSRTLCFGGNDGAQDLNEAWIFDHVFMWWEEIAVPSIVLPRLASACQLNGRITHQIICVGGLVSSTLAPVNDNNIWIFDMYGLQISHLPSSAGTVALRGGGAFLNVPKTGLTLVGGRSFKGPLGDVQQIYPSNGSYGLRQVLGSVSHPAARTDSCSAVVGNGAIVAFGRDATSVFNDVYYYDSDVSKQAFYEITVGEGLRPSPRYGASATVSASTVYFFGGVLEDRRTLANDLWRLNINIPNRTATWELVTPTTPTSPRAFHSSFFYNYRIFIIGGMLGNTHTFTGDMAVFEILDLTWRVVSIQPPLRPSAAHGFVRSMDGGTFTIIGGRYEAYGAVQLLGDIHQLTVPEYGSYISNHVVVRASGPVRSNFAVAVSGNNTLICGGITQSTPIMQSAPKMSDQCHYLRIENSQATITPVVVSDANASPVKIGANAWAVGDSMYIFGGTLVKGQIEHPLFMTSDLYRSVNNASALCTQGQPDDSECFHCAAGYLNPQFPNATCTLVPAGYYATRPYLNSTACPPGTYSNLVAATTAYACQQCPAGTYSSIEGSTMCLPCTNPTCPIGSVSPNQAETVVATRLVSQQPDMFPVGTLPIWMWSLIGVLAFCGVLLVFVPTLVSNRLREHRRESYFPPDTLLKLRSVYELHKLPHFGVNPEGLRLILQELEVKYITPKYVHTIVAENDQDGTGHLTFPHFQDALIQLIDKGFLPPFTTRSYTANTLEQRLVNFDLKVFDAYDREHSLGVNGDMMRYQTTRVGGIFRITFFVIAISMILLLSGQFYYTNIIEVRSEVPSISRKFVVQTQSLNMQFTVAGGVHSENSCQQNSEGLCAAGVTFTLNTEYVSKYASMTPSCSYNATAKSCTLQISCAHCSFNFDSNVIVSALFPPEVYASSIEVGVSAYTGIKDSISAVAVAFEPSFSKVFRGYPPTSVTATLTATHYTSVNNVIQQEPVEGEGYHVQYVDSIPGQSVEAIELSRHLSVPITLDLTVTNGLLDISRNPQKSLLDFISQLLGAIPGMGGVLLLFMAKYDKGFITRRFNKVRGELENDMCDGNGVMKCTTDDPSLNKASNDDDSSLSTALMVDSDFHQGAEESLQVMKPTSQEEEDEHHST